MVAPAACDYYHSGVSDERSVHVPCHRYFYGAFIFAGFSFLGAIDTMFAIMSDKIGSNVYILVFLVLLGIMVAAIQKSALRRHMVIMQRVRSREREALFSLR